MPQAKPTWFYLQKALEKDRSLPYETTVSAPQEVQFQKWVQEKNIPTGGNYDMRGFHNGMITGDPRARSGISPIDNLLHFTDTWKAPGHPKFSSDSMYAKPNAPKWIGDKLVNSRGEVIKLDILD